MTRDVWITPLFQASIPFAVVGSNQQIEAKGKKVRGRLYPWGVVEVENLEHNDFLKLRIMLMWVVEEPKFCFCYFQFNGDIESYKLAKLYMMM